MDVLASLRDECQSSKRLLGFSGFSFFFNGFGLFCQVLAFLDLLLAFHHTCVSVIVVLVKISRHTLDILSLNVYFVRFVLNLICFFERFACLGFFSFWVALIEF